MAKQASWGVEKDEKAVAAYLRALPLPVRLIARQLDTLAREELPGVTVGIKWSVPFYALAGPVCYISAAKAHVTLGLVQGDAIDDASGLLTGTGKSPIRKAVFRAGEAVPEETVRGWLKAALRVQADWGR